MHLGTKLCTATHCTAFIVKWRRLSSLAELWLLYLSLALTFVSFIPFFEFGYWSLLATRLQKYYVIFVYSLQGKMGKTGKNRKKITQLKSLKYQNPKDENMGWKKHLQLKFHSLIRRLTRGRSKPRPICTKLQIPTTMISSALNSYTFLIVAEWTKKSIDFTLVTQLMLQRRPNRSELRSMDSYIQIICRFQKCKRKVPPPSLLSTKK